MSHFTAVETESQKEETTQAPKVERALDLCVLHVPNAFLAPPAGQVHKKDCQRQRHWRWGGGGNGWDQEIIHSHAVVGLGDVVECRDSGFILGLHSKVPIVGHKLQDNSNLG